MDSLCPLCSLWFLCCILLLIQWIPAQQDRSAVYECDFQQIQPGQLPEEFKILRGEFTVKQEGENRLLELGVGELNSFGLLLGPERTGDGSIRARLRGWPTGKRFPEFGVGLGGTRGHQLWLMPAVNELQLRRDNRILARAPFDFKPGQWVQLRLDIRPGGENRWIVAGNAWWEGESPPAQPLVQHEPTDPPPPGRASLWGTPYSEKVIQFDDIAVR